MDEAVVRRQLAELEQRRERIVESYLDGIISRTRRDQELAEIAEHSAAAAALLKQEPAPPAPALTREDVAALALVLAEYAFLEREAKRVMLEALTPRIYVRKYAVVGVELPTRAFMQTSGEAWLREHAEQCGSQYTSTVTSLILVPGVIREVPDAAAHPAGGARCTESTARSSQHAGSGQ